MKALLFSLALLLPLAGEAAEPRQTHEESLAERLQQSLEAQEVTVDFRRPLMPEPNREPNQENAATDASGPDKH